MEIFAPAKINLSLDITGRRADGYHSLRMVMQSISLFDKVSLTETKDKKIEILCNDLDIPCEAENTVSCAAEAFLKQTGIPLKSGLLFQIDKKIPQQAGLGGGSTDAAAALKLLDYFFQTHLTSEQLRKIGLSIGADVPFCIINGTALAEGVGEKLRPIQPMPFCYIVVCKPPVGINTKEAYKAFDDAGCALTDYTEQMLNAFCTGNLKIIGRSLGNVFESAGVPQDVNEIESDMLNAGSLGACMTGSGSAVFGLFDDLSKATQCRDALLQKYNKTFLCHPVSSEDKEALI